MLVILKGITKKGRDRIDQHGSVWVVENQTDSMGRKLLKSNTTNYLKWGSRT